MKLFTIIGLLLLSVNTFASEGIIINCRADLIKLLETNKVSTAAALELDNDEFEGTTWPDTGFEPFTSDMAATLAINIGQRTKTTIITAENLITAITTVDPTGKNFEVVRDSNNTVLMIKIDYDMFGKDDEHTCMRVSNGDVFSDNFVCNYFYDDFY